MHKFISKLAMTVAAASVLVTGSLPKPAAAQSQGTINTILGAAALIGGIVLYNNYEHKRQQANTVVGYTQNGGTIYGDGRIVMPNGQTIYPNGNGQYPWGQYAYYSPRANYSTYTYDYQRTGQYDRTHHHGRYQAYGHDNDNGHGNYGHNNGNGNGGHDDGYGHDNDNH